MFIIEGADHLGKTTTAHQLVKSAEESQEDFPIRYGHMSRPADCFNHSTDYLDLMSLYAVQDRFHLGGIVYQQRITPSCLKWIEGELKIRGSFIMLMVVPESEEDWYRHRLSAEGKKELFSVEKILEHNRVYRKMAGSNSIWIDTVRWCSEDDPFPQKPELALHLAAWLDRLKFLKESIHAS